MTTGSTGPAELRGTPGPANRGVDRGARTLLALALLLGLVRFWRLGTWSLWIDEALTLSDSVHGGSFKNFLGYGLIGIYLDQLAERPSEFALRLPSAVLGWLSLPLTAWAFWPLVGRRAAAAGTLLLAVSSWHVYWSQNARFYTLALVLSVLGSGLTVRGLLRNRLGLLAGGLAIAAAAGLAHPGAFTLLPVLIVAPSVARLLRRPLPGTGNFQHLILDNGMHESTGGRAPSPARSARCSPSAPWAPSRPCPGRARSGPPGSRRAAAGRPCTS